jgi:hypothetical protein
MHDINRLFCSLRSHLHSDYRLVHHPPRDRQVETRQSKAEYPSPETVAAVERVVFAGKKPWTGLDELIAPLSHESVTCAAL